MHHILETLWHVLTETLPLMPFLYLTYLAMEALERYAGEKTQRLVRRAGRAGPALGGVLGIIPQCGFSASGAGLYAARVITPGTLVALFLSTSDEMLPVMLSSAVPPLRIVKLLAVKVVVAIAVGFMLDAVIRLLRRHKNAAATCVHDHDHEEEFRMEELCRSGHCHCDERPVWLSSLIHTASVGAVIYLVSLVLHSLIHHGGEALIERVAALPSVLACLVTSVIGMIPSCAASVALTELHLSGGLSVGALMAGLLTGAGAGTIVLLRANRPRKNTLVLLAMLYVVGVAVGTLIDLTPLAGWLA
ncbi:MAG: arsenic efflux protein [Clostridia bacterium]|nr:arsenic efflux protein [Clostridia bacterium]